MKKETAKAYFVDDHYTYRKKVLKEEIGITKELISEIMVVYLEENDFAKARSIFAAHNMERLEDTKKKIENFRKISTAGFCSAISLREDTGWGVKQAKEHIRKKGETYAKTKIYSRQF